MNKGTIQLKGLQRNFPAGMNDGGCDEFINLRFTKGAFRPIGKKKYLYPLPEYNRIWAHKTDVFENWIGFNASTNQIEWYDPNSTDLKQTITTISTELIDIQFLKRYLIVVTATEIAIFLFQDKYTDVSSFSQPELVLKEQTSGVLTTESATDADGLIGKWYKLINESSEASPGRVTGAFSYRVAYKLYDGTYVLHTTPVVLNTTIGEEQHYGIVKNSSGNYTIDINFYHPGIVELASTYYANVPSDIVTSIVVFASRVETLWDIESTITDDVLNGISSGSQKDFSEIGVLSDAFKDISDPAGFYQVIEIPLSAAKGAVTGTITKPDYFNWTNFYSDYATRRLMPFDNNTHSTLTGLAPYIYNDRLILGNAIESFESPEIKITDATTSPLDRSFQVQVRLQTSIGDIWVVGPWFSAKTQDLGGGNESVLFESILAYPDSRAREMLILINDSPIVELYTQYLISNTAKTDTHIPPITLGISDFSEAQTPSGTIGTSSAMMFLSATQARTIKLLGSLIGTPTLNTKFDYYVRIYDDLFALKESIFLGTIEDGGAGFVSVNKNLSLAIGDSFEVVALTSNSSDQITYNSWALQITETVISGSNPNKVLETYILNESNLSNYAYHENPDFDKDYTLPNVNWRDIKLEFVIASLTSASSAQNNRISGVLNDSNAYAPSEVQNPYIFPLDSRGQVGTGSIIDFGTNTEPISEGQFGQYPLYTFTSEGIWALTIGLSDVFITSEAPLSREVLIRRGAKTDISFGIVYATLEGLKMISGKEVIELSETSEGLPDQYFSDNEQLQYFLNLPQTVNVSGIVDKIPFNEYLANAVIGYNKAFDTNEIYVANPDYDYVWMFNLKHKMWAKVSGKYTGFINFYPELYGMRATSGDEAIVNISSEIKSNVPCYFHTKALSMSGNEIFKKLHRSFLRGFLNMASGKYSSLYLFGSDNLIDWTFITGNDRNSGSFNNIWITHSNKSYRYYNYVFAAEIDFDPVLDSHIKYIEFQEKQKWARKLR
jgi:hypothetical protein